ncbi:MAG: hypothetical protein AAF614_25555 [Chloroflexota bacterium]
MKLKAVAATKSRKIKQVRVKSSLKAGTETGIVKYIGSKGFGFIEPDDHSGMLLFEIHNPADADYRISDRVEYKLEMGPKGPKGFDVKRLS